jgi:hypothetical protein
MRFSRKRSRRSRRSSRSVICRECAVLSRLASNNRQPSGEELPSCARSAAETCPDVPARSPVVDVDMKPGWSGPASIRMRDRVRIMPPPQWPRSLGLVRPLEWRRESQRTFQVMRRTLGKDMQQHGTLKDTQGMLRHASIKTAGDVYLQTIEQSVLAAANSRTSAVLGDWRMPEKSLSSKGRNLKGLNGIRRRRLMRWL